MGEEKRSPTERVRTMLDEQGVEYHECKANECVSFDFGYCPQCDDYRKEIIVAGEYIEVAQKYLSPEQAIAATVGAGTCHMEVKDNLDESEGMGDVWLECDRCHWQMMLEPTTPRFKYCPNCRARIKEETE